MLKLLAILFISLSLSTPSFSQEVTPAADQTELFLPLLKGKTVACVVNQTSISNGMHLVDRLNAEGINIKIIFAPEHGFRGEADAGEKVNNETDKKTGIPIFSLYGKTKSPTPESLTGVDYVIFDIQDVGARFYTYISTLHHVMEACGKQKVPVLVLDRPNPNGMYMDGPVLEKEFSSFVGIHPIPIVHGNTIGELAQMICGEKWVSSNPNIIVFPCKNYTHQQKYILPIKPSPNLPNETSIALYASLCLFEGTNISVARGTDFPFQAIGYPDSSMGKFSFCPRSIQNAAKNPLYEGQDCFGLDLRNTQNSYQFTLSYLIEFYKKSKNKDKYFNAFFDKLAGTGSLKKQIIAGLSEDEIRLTWQENLEKYKKIRVKYLLYP